MSLSNEEWRDARRDMNRGGRFGILWLVIVIIVIAAISIAIWASRVGTSDIKGQGDVTIQKNSAENRIAAETEFQDLFNEAEATERKADDAYEVMCSDPDNAHRATEYIGLKQHYENVVARYNAKADSPLSRDFLPSNLPERYNAVDFESTCEEN